LCHGCGWMEMDHGLRWISWFPMVSYGSHGLVSYGSFSRPRALPSRRFTGSATHSLTVSPISYCFVCMIYARMYNVTSMYYTTTITFLTIQYPLTTHDTHLATPDNSPFIPPSLARNDIQYHIPSITAHRGAQPAPPHARSEEAGKNDQSPTGKTGSHSRRRAHSQFPRTRSSLPLRPYHLPPIPDLHSTTAPTAPLSGGTDGKDGRQRTRKIERHAPGKIRGWRDARTHARTG
jgi:hypothetical protein